MSDRLPGRTLRALLPSEIVSRIELAISESTTSGWLVSHHAFDEFPSADSSDVLDKSFAVGVTDTTRLEGRQRRGVGAHAVSEVVIRIAAHAQGDGKAESYKRHLDLEADIVHRVMALNNNPDLEVQLVSIGDRQVLTPTIRYSQVNLTVRHLYPLQ